ncbi:MocR-like pyridoxine biosynthesis transcription factor PdxR [Geminicoccus roseus]|uniref:MocR-like pyridoxine biosynthesis transcription factor PdxR n=1 Tax=Geminicoccus roseus TaxID=404900 RepID=UPI0004247C18|nr:PLP-dependent aminotransferase family protein [Geminicoccus roseus]
MTTNAPDWSSLMPVLPGEGPKARALYLALRRLIETGMAPPGSKLPPTRELARRLGLSRPAAVAAFEMLVADGYAQAKVGAGTFVAPQVPAMPPGQDQPRPPEPPPAPPKAFDPGVALADRRTMDIFRRLLVRQLADPGPEHFHYGDPRGGLVLREAIAAYLRTARGVRCDARQIVLTSGTQQGLDLLLRCIAGPGDAVWLEDPCYPMARQALAGTGARAIGVPVDAEGLDPAAGAKVPGPVRAVYVTPSHQFPLGVAMSMPRRLELLDWAAREDAWIIEDDYDSEFRFAGPPLTALQGMDRAQRVAYLGTFSKVLFPGLRMGYAVLPPPLLDAVLDLRARTDRQPPTLAEGAVAGLLAQNHFAAHLRRARRHAQAARDLLVETLRQAAGDRLQVAAPAQGLHLVAWLQDGLSDVALAAAAQAAGIGCRPLSPLYLAAPPRQGLVLGFSGFPLDQVRKSASRLGRIVAEATPGR